MDARCTTAAVLLVPLLLFSYFAHTFLALLLRQHRSPLRDLPGPPAPSLLMGNLAEMHDQENTNLIARWAARYGTTFVYRGFVGGVRLLTTDPTAVAHILGHAYDYPKPEFVRDSLASMAAGHDGLLTVEGDAHRRQRKILGPAFSTTHVRSLVPIFEAKAAQLRDIWLAAADAAAPAPASVDVLAWFGRATLDVIGLAGFGYTFDALTTDDSELAKAFAVIFSTARKFRVMTILQVWFPVLRRFRRNNAAMAQAQATMRRIGLELIRERQAEVAAELATFTEKGAPVDGDKTVLGRDILSVLIRSNIASAPAARMSIEETLCQISTFLAAGQETTASALTWTLYALAKAPAAQARLRAALRAHGAHAEYAEWVVREALRLHAPVTSTMRVCARAADSVPVGGAGFADRHGVRRRAIALVRGDIVTVPLQAINRSAAVWGPDALEFRPERWADPPAAARAIPGLYAHTLTFLNGNPLDGNRACIGYKFALTEIKTFLHVLLTEVEVSIDPATVIEKRVNVVTRPFVKSAPELGNQMPLYVRRAPPDSPSTQ